VVALVTLDWVTVGSSIAQLLPALHGHAVWNGAMPLTIRGASMGTRLATQLLLLAVCLFSLEGPPAHAQWTTELHGITSIGLVVELHEDAKRCGISKSTITDVFMYVASTADLPTTSETIGPQVIVRLNTLFQPQPGQCISNLTMEVGNYQQVTLDYGDHQSPFVWVVLWRDAWLTVSIAERHDAKIRSTVEASTKKLVTAWRLANTSQRP
jgi:hypothetical protein